jgi:ABC-2 type transport system ATP-binding protein
MLRVRGLGKRLGGRSLFAGLELALGAGETAFVLGPNGSGKSTLLRVLSGIVAPDRGEIEIAGHDALATPALAKAKLGYVPDGLDALPDLRVSELLALTRSLGALPRTPSAAAARWEERLGVTSLAAELLRSLSFGQHKRVALAAALAKAPPLLLLDEPTNGLDPAGVELLHELFAERRSAGQSQLVTTNDLDFVERSPGQRYELLSGKLQPSAELQSDARTTRRSK